MRALLVDWGYRLQFAWYGLDKGTAAFFAVLPLPFALLAYLIYSVYGDYAQAAAERRRQADLLCLAQNVYYEARGEILDGQYAVAEVTMNRASSPLFPDTVCEVVFEKRWDRVRQRHVGAFSWTELGDLPRPRGVAWQRAIDVATAVYDGEHSPHVPKALYYHADHIEPSWASSGRRVATIGNHLFYR
jgi:spore germination cell wall hydrolase CwlJ-like protein